VIRNLDGSGANQWYAGDALLDTGQVGSGFIDLYSVAGVLSGAGPTIVGNVRTGTTYNNIAPRWAIGNLNGLYSYATDVYGVGMGDPSDANLVIDATNGLRIRNSTTVYAVMASSIFRLGASGGNRVEWDGTNLAVVSADLVIDSSGITLGPAGAAGYIPSNAYKWGATDGTLGITGMGLGGIKTLWIEATHNGSGGAGQAGIVLNADTNTASPNPSRIYVGYNGVAGILGGTNTGIYMFPGTGFTALIDGPVKARGDFSVLESTGGATFTVTGSNGNTAASGILTVSGFGVHSFSAGGAGIQALDVSNTSAGATNQAFLGATSNIASIRLRSYSTTWTTANFQVASGGSLDFEGAGGLSIVAANASGVIRFYSGGTTKRAQINTNGTQTWAPYGAGTATFDASGNITSVSDARYKDRVSTLPYGLPEVLALRPVMHGYNALSGLDRFGMYGGFLAQQVQTVIPLAIGRNSDGYLTLSDRPILGAVVHAIQTLDERLKALEEQKAA
jgi:hypothetical protein